MEFLSPELRLAWAVLLNAAVWGCAYRFARRRCAAGALQAACDAFLVYYVVQYAAVALPGILGAFNLLTMSAVAFVAMGLLLFGAPHEAAGAARVERMARRGGHRHAAGDEVHGRVVCPLLLFLVDAPFRAGWPARHWALAAAVALLLAGPWYVRNAVLTGNPFYPLDVGVLGVRVFTRLFSTTRAEDVRDAAGVVRVLFRDQYHSLPLQLAVALLLGCAVGIAAAGRTALRDPERRAVLIGTPLTLASFFLTLPNQEARFASPLFALLFAAAAPALARWSRPAAVSALLVAGLLVFSMATFAAPDLWHRVAGMALTALVVAGLAAGAWTAQVRYLRLRAQSVAIAAIFGGLIVAMFVYVEWAAYLDAYYLKGTEEPEGIPGRYAEAYGPQAALWEFVRENVPDDATVAVANTYFVYPFYDARFRRRIVYAPVRADLPDYAHLPRLGDAIPADLLAQRATDVMNTHPDRATWLENLSGSSKQQDFTRSSWSKSPAKSVIIKAPAEAVRRAGPDELRMGHIHVPVAPIPGLNASERRRRFAGGGRTLLARLAGV